MNKRPTRLPEAGFFSFNPAEASKAPQGYRLQVLPTPLVFLFFKCYKRPSILYWRCSAHCTPLTVFFSQYSSVYSSAHDLGATSASSIASCGLHALNAGSRFPLSCSNRRHRVRARRCCGQHLYLWWKPPPSRRRSRNLGVIIGWFISTHRHGFPWHQYHIFGRPHHLHRGSDALSVASNCGVSLWKRLSFFDFLTCHYYFPFGCLFLFFARHLWYRRAETRAVLHGLCHTISLA